MFSPERHFPRPRQHGRTTPSGTPPPAQLPSPPQTRATRNALSLYSTEDGDADADTYDDSDADPAAYGGDEL